MVSSLLAQEEENMPNAELHGHGVWLFINNPHSSAFPDPLGFGASYDILTDTNPVSYSVPINSVSIGDGDVAFVYRVSAGAVKRDPGAVVAVARVRSSPWFTRWGYCEVNWELQPLPPEMWLASADMQASGLWQNRVPFTGQNLASSPVRVTREQWEWLSVRLPATALAWLEDHAIDK